MDAGTFVEELAAARIGRTFNQYATGDRAELLRSRLVDYLERRAEAQVLLVGEAPGYRGARVSGLPFTSECQLTGAGPAESTATIVHRVLEELALADEVLLWNVVPTHPGTAWSNRAPTRDEVESGLEFVRRLTAGKAVLAVGRVAERALGVRYVRHPSHAGAAQFREQLTHAVQGLVARSHKVSRRDPSRATPRSRTPTSRARGDPFPRGCEVSS